jgi:hypothetical protein
VYGTPSTNRDLALLKGSSALMVLMRWIFPGRPTDHDHFTLHGCWCGTIGQYLHAAVPLGAFLKFNQF